jgi:hypothetical protein
VNTAAAKLDGLIAGQQAGENISSEQITAARQDYQQKQALLLSTAETELDSVYNNLPNGIKARESDPLAYAANDIDSRYAADPEFSVALKAAVAIRRVNDAASQGVDKQMDVLGQVLPRRRSLG